jgi:hypothetical protein
MRGGVAYVACIECGKPPYRACKAENEVEYAMRSTTFVSTKVVSCEARDRAPNLALSAH